jgi:hypothetical protein
MKRAPITIEQLKATPAGQRPQNAHLFSNSCKNGNSSKKAKYHNVKVELDSKTFDSQKEAKRYIELRALQIAGEISHLHCQTPFELSVCKYIADFTYTQNSKLVVEDVKSSATRKLSTYRLKKKLIKAELNIEIIEI